MASPGFGLVAAACLALALALPASAAAPEQPVYDIIDRVVGAGASEHFELHVTSSDGKGDGSNSYTLSDAGNGKLAVSAGRVTELTAGVGYYLREYANMTIGWPRGGGSRAGVPAAWPAVGGTVTRSRRVPFSYIMNVCTHSYSLVWYSWVQWEPFIDWMALSGINYALAMTGQEEVQYKVFAKLGLNDTEIRGWFNGPAFLTWSRGQNEYGNGIAGMLPRSWMKSQWELQKQILGRYRELGIIGQLPGFQGNVPVQLKTILADANITKQGDTGWMDSLDPQFGKIADLWMETLIADFGTDHHYQLDGYFDGSTAPWMTNPNKAEVMRNLKAQEQAEPYNWDDVEPDPMAYRRGALAYQGLNRTDPDAVWSFQGWAFIGWSNPKQASFIKGFVEAAPADKFSVIDMSTNGEGEWLKWNSSAFFGAKFVWTTLHDFGGTDGMKGNLNQINEIPFAALPPEKTTNVWGTGYTPEGIDQNPVYYEFVMESNFRTERVADIREHIVTRSHRRYNLATFNEDVSEAWSLLVAGAYAQDVSVQDPTGVPHLSGHASQFGPNGYKPLPVVCLTFAAWKKLLAAAKDVPMIEPFRYDLVNLGREILAQISTPLSMNFSQAIASKSLDADLIKAVGEKYADLLHDVDELVGTDEAFLLGPWISMARQFAQPGVQDCSDNGWGITDCADYYEWNARSQLTTWNPTPKDAAKIPGGPIDYASKHWNGLVGGYYAKRVELITAQAILDATAGGALNSTAVAKIEATLAYTWTTATNKYPSAPTGDPIATSEKMLAKYEALFASC